MICFHHRKDLQRSLSPFAYLIFAFRILLFSFTPKDIPNRRARQQESGERTATEKKTTSKKEKKRRNEGTACQVLTWAQDWLTLRLNVTRYLKRPSVSTAKIYRLNVPQYSIEKRASMSALMFHTSWHIHWVHKIDCMYTIYKYMCRSTIYLDFFLLSLVCSSISYIS